MSSIQKRGDKWRAFVLVDGKRYSKTFRLKKEALEWAITQEEDGVLENHTFKDLIVKYRPVAEKHLGSKSETSKLNRIQEKVSFIDTPLEYITKAMLSGWRDARINEVGPSTVNREFCVIRAMFNMAVRDLGWLRTNPALTVTLPADPPPRRRGVSQVEIDTITEVLEKTPHGKPVAQMFKLSIETGMRMGEMLSLTWDRVKDKFVILDRTKNGDRREVPLSPVARAIIADRRGIDPEKVFDLTTPVATDRFIKAKKRTPYKDVRFHDARSEAVTRLSKKLDVMQLAKMIGHRDPRSLMFYYAESSDSLADRL